jgi:PadR family transcriptional regulator PadR
MNSFKYSTALSILRCTVWNNRDGVVSKWETAPDRNREFKYYRLAEKGRKQLVVAESRWKQMADAVARIMWPTAEEN